MDSQDLRILQNIIDTQTDKLIGQIAEVKTELLGRMADEKNELIDYIAEVDQTAEERIRDAKGELNARFDNLEQYYRIHKLEELNQSELMRILLDLQKRVNALEQKSA